MGPRILRALLPTRIAFFGSVVVTPVDDLAQGSGEQPTPKSRLAGVAKAVRVLQDFTADRLHEVRAGFTVPDHGPRPQPDIGSQGRQMVLEQPLKSAVISASCGEG